MAVPLQPVAVRSRPGLEPEVSVYSEYRPDPAINAAAVCTWHGVAGWPRPMRLLPDGCLDLVWDGQRAQAIRPAARPVRRPVGDTAVVTGIRIRPGWAAVALGRPARALPDVADLADAWGPAPARRLEAALATAATPEQCRAILTGAVARRLADSAGPHPGVLAAVSLLGKSGVTAGDAARRAALSPRQLRRLFGDHVGLPPKTLQTILRFQRFRAWLAVSGQAPIPLGRAAAECGYFDHAQLCRECNRLAGATPSILQAAAPPSLALAGSWSSSGTGQPDREPP
jgi:AraC-like DNA-binding protein